MHATADPYLLARRKRDVNMMSEAIQRQKDELLKELAEVKKLYNREKRQYRLAWVVSLLLSLLPGFATPVIYGLQGQVQFDVLKPVLIILPITGSIGGWLLATFPFLAMYRLREDGRIRVDDLIAEAEAIYAETDQEFLTMRKKIRMARNELSAEQAHEFFSSFEKARPVRKPEARPHDQPPLHPGEMGGS